MNISSIMKDVIDKIEEGVNIVDDKGILLFANKLSALYANCEQEEMVGKHISDFYPQAALLTVLETQKAVTSVKKVLHENGKIYEVKANPIIVDGRMAGGFAIFTDITEIEYLNNRIDDLEMKISIKDNHDAFAGIHGSESSLKSTIQKAKKTVGALGGPRHSVITGESGTGKTMLARAIYYYAKEIGVIKSNAPFIEVNCAQFTNIDIAAMEIFGSKEGAYTGSKDKKGLFELANGGMLFLDEVHDLDHYQDLLLKALEQGCIRRIGGVEDIKVDVIVVAASTKDLKTVFIPELYQRLAQYELMLPPLRDRTLLEKKTILECFINKYEESVLERYGIDMKIVITQRARNILLNAYYKRNIRQFRDVVNASIDAGVPLINNISSSRTIVATIDCEHLPVEFLNESNEKIDEDNHQYNDVIFDFNNNPKMIDRMVKELHLNGLGPRRIAKILNGKGIDIKYYQVAYKLKKLND